MSYHINLLNSYTIHNDFKNCLYCYSLLRSSNLAWRSASASVVPAPPPSATAAGFPLAAGAKEPGSKKICLKLEF